MNDKLQELTQKIYNEGLEKGRKEADEILANARKESDNLLKNAKQEAEKIVERAKQETDELRKNVNSEMIMSSKQAITTIKQQISAIVMSKAVNEAVNQAFEDKDFLKKIIIGMVENWSKLSDANQDIMLTLSEKDRDDLETYLLGKVAKLVKNGIDINFTEGIKSGFKIGPKEGGYMISFTDHDFEHFFKQYLRPRTNKLLYGEK
nr:V-type ATP synthase subunit E [Bacteroidota bacterium]